MLHYLCQISLQLLRFLCRCNLSVLPARSISIYFHVQRDAMGNARDFSSLIKSLATMLTKRRLEGARRQHMESMHHHDFLKLFFASYRLRDKIKYWTIFHGKFSRQIFIKKILRSATRGAEGGLHISHFHQFCIAPPLCTISLSYRECRWWLHVTLSTCVRAMMISIVGKNLITAAAVVSRKISWEALQASTALSN